MSEFERYSRQLLVDQVGEQGQQRLSDAKILIVGAGGLGCQVAAQLAGAGIGNICIVDHDIVSLSNLHRQILFRETDIGQAKASVAVRELRAINSKIELQAVEARLAMDNVEELVNAAELVVDAADNFATSYLLSDTCLAKHKPMLSASVNRTFGYLGVFCGTREKPAPSMRAVFPKLPLDQQSCDTVGVTGPSVGIIASLQAQEALKILLDDDDQLLGRLLYCDLWNYKQHLVDFSAAAEPDAQQIELISSEQIQESDMVIDIRNADEVAKTPQAFRVDREIPLPELVLQAIDTSATQRIVLACQSGQRAMIGAQQLLDQGHEFIAAVIPDSSQD